VPESSSELIWVAFDGSSVSVSDERSSSSQESATGAALGFLEEEEDMSSFDREEARALEVLDGVAMLGGLAKIGGLVLTIQ